MDTNNGVKTIDKKTQPPTVAKKTPPPVPKKPVMNKTAGAIKTSTVTSANTAKLGASATSITPAVASSTTAVSRVTSVTPPVGGAKKPTTVTSRQVREKMTSSTVAKSKPVTKTLPEKAKRPPSPEYVTIRGLKVPIAVKSMKQRLKEEIQIVTASRRLKIDEMEEIRIMERQLEELRAQERKQKEESELKELKEKTNAEVKAKPLLLRPNQENRRKPTPPATTITSRMSPQASPRRARHKRQNSDPMVAKFSPIEEAKDIESDFVVHEERKLISRERDSSPHKPLTRIGSATPPASSHLTPRVSLPKLSKSSELLSSTAPETVTENPLSSSQSETLLSRTSPKPGARNAILRADENERKSREDRTLKLRLEIQKRKEQIEENARLQQEIRKMVDSVDVPLHNLEEVRHKFAQQIRLTDVVRPSDKIPTGIIRPIDYEDIANMEYNILPDTYPTKVTRSLPQTPTDYYDNGNYSSSEYLAHKSERSPQRDFNRYVSDFENARSYVINPEYFDARMVTSQSGNLVKSAEMIYTTFGDSRDSGMSSGVNVIDGQPGTRQELNNVSQFEMYADITPNTTDADTTPPSENMVSMVTPAMPLLDDVTARSRKIIREMGGRPLSDDMEKYFAQDGESNH